ncbi:Coenzyme Q-binding protein coq10a, mitochondrial [Chytridiales sp. JEL 0842]|nr:Coenzyme Q-binding protein coq10a, mitochondrial [Chytridiales sp. JEL 0842]
MNVQRAGERLGNGGSKGLSHRERKLFNFSQRQLYNIISDVDKYKHFVPFCIISQVLSKRFIPPNTQQSSTTPAKNYSKMIMKADLEVGFQAFTERYTSEVTCTFPREVKAVASQTHLFKTLITTWKFTPVKPINATATKSIPPPPADASRNIDIPPSLATKSIEDPADYPQCYVDFHIEFEFRSPLYAHVATIFFNEVSRMMVKAFEERAVRVYGSRPSLHSGQKKSA